MTKTISAGLGRARHLYDEQLQRQQQEKRLFASFGPGTGGGLLGRGRGDPEGRAPAETEQSRS